MKKEWIYQIRAIAIIAVVVCHQQYILHRSEVIQLITLYSVTTLIFLMGVTKFYSLNKSGLERYGSIWRYSINSMNSVLLSYAVASFLYTYQREGKLDNVVYLKHLINFSASAPFYFVKYYFWLTIWAPFIYMIIKKVYQRVFLTVLVFLVFWIFGYITTGNLNIFGSSYLFVYALGLEIGILSNDKTFIVNKKIFCFATFFFLVFGGISTKRFYWSRIGGNYSYSEGIDILCPKLQMNPPNLSIIIYSFGVIMLGYLFFSFINKSSKFITKIVAQFFSVIGKNSMDVFLWHLFIQSILNMYLVDLDNLIIKNIIYYSMMICIPIICRMCYIKIKDSVYDVIFKRNELKE